jgi:hypothetical protein
MNSNDFVERREKIETLRDRGATQGERAAAEAALDRIRVPTPMKIIGTVVDIDREVTFYDVEFRHVEGDIRRRSVAKELFLRPTKVAEEMIRFGADLPDVSTAAAAIVTEATAQKDSAFRQVTRQAGWIEKHSVVWPGRTFGKLAGSLSYLPSSGLDPAFGLSKGTLVAWRDGLREPCAKSDYLIMALGHKAANLLLTLIGEGESSVLHLHGTKAQDSTKAASSSGKTLATRVAASMTGRCMKNDLHTFAITVPGVNDLCFARNNFGVELDEEARSVGDGSKRTISSGELSYLLTSGRGNVRSDFATQHADLKNKVWLTNAITSGERPLDDAHNGDARAEGSKVRMLGLPVPAGGKGGIFNRTRKTGKDRRVRAKRLAEQTEHTIANNYGVAMPALIEASLRDVSDTGSLAKSLTDDLVRSVVQDGDPWERRFARKLAIAGAGAILLSRFGIGPWSEKRARRAFRRIYKRARLAVSDADEIATALIKSLGGKLANGEFPEILKGSKVSRSVAESVKLGFIRTLPGLGRSLLLTLDCVRALVARKELVDPVLRRLIGQGFVHRGDDGKSTRQVQVKELAHGRPRYVCIAVAKLAALRR